VLKRFQTQIFEKEEEFKTKYKVLNKFNSKIKANNVTNKLN
jgi:hypothetical protein